jgi:hypothetical protein
MPESSVVGPLFIVGAPARHPGDAEPSDGPPVAQVQVMDVGGFGRVHSVREGEYQLAAPRRVTRSRRGPGIAEFRIRLEPRPPREVCERYNATKPSEAPQATLRPDGFVVLCPEEDIARRLDLIRQHALSHLAEITIDLRDAP